jgi:AAA+ ATPase superfamily predicted ATPase
MKCNFVGREYELGALQRLTDKRTASMVVVTGRRRIGKSRLIEEFAERNKRYRHVSISGLAPQHGITPSSQRSAFVNQMQRELDLPPVQHDDWLDIFVHLARATQDSRSIVLLDEVSWMGKDDPEFLPKLKLAWDGCFKDNPNLILILCGSVSSWLERNILSNTGFVGRVSLHLRVEELSLPNCDTFWGKARKRVSFFDKLKMLSVTGGVPKYLEEIIVKDSAEENIKHLCFSPEGLLFREFDQIFSDLFDKRGPIYERIVTTLANGPCTMAQICEKLSVAKSGVLSEYLDDLSLAGFIHRDYTWDLKTRKESKLSRFRLCDNYVRFYLKYILPNRHKIQDRRLAERPVSALPGWDTIAGLQFENLVLANRDFIWKQCGLSASEIEMDGPFFQQRTKRRQGCQVDYLIQTRHGPLYLCEIKFSRNPITTDVEQDLQEKVTRIDAPRHCSILPVLIHANKVNESVLYGDTFARIIDFSSILLT